MCLLEELIKNISKDWSTLDKNELKSYMISGSIFLELIGLVISSLVLFLIVDLPTSFVINIIIGFTILTLLSAIIVYNRDYLDGKYGLFYEEYKGLSYRGVVLFFIPASIAFAFIIYPIASHQGGIYSAIGFCLAALYPAFFMFLRINVYKNENKTLNSMVPLWKKNKNELKDEDYNNFYKEKFFDFARRLNASPPIYTASAPKTTAVFNTSKLLAGTKSSALLLLAIYILLPIIS